MPRTARIVIPGLAHHVTQQGNNRQDVFFVDDDRRAYLSFLEEQSDKYGLEVSGYCLMSNHIHLIATPEKGNSLATDHFLAKLEVKLGCRLRIPKPGRPRKKQE